MKSHDYQSLKLLFLIPLILLLASCAAGDTQFLLNGMVSKIVEFKI